MNKEFAQLNDKYNDDTYPIFPFVSKNKITLLKSGLYKKHKANFRGITATFNQESGEYEFPLYGMYLVKEDMVIVPEGLELNESKSAFLNAALKAGFNLSNKPPKFETVKFAPDSIEAKLALSNKVDFQFSQAPMEDMEELYDPLSN